MDNDGLKKGFDQKIVPGTAVKLLRRAAVAPFTGRMLFRRGQQSVTLFFREGFIVNARTNNTAHRLGDILMETLGLSEEVIQKAVRTAKVKDRPLGMILLQEKTIGPHDLYQGLVRQVELILGGLSEWESGTCYLHPDAEPDKDVVLLKVSPVKVLEQPSPPAPAPREEAEKVPRAGQPEPPREEAAPPPPPGPPPPPPGPPSLGDEMLLRATVTREARPSDEVSVNGFIAEKEAVREGDHYAMLGVERRATFEDVRQAYQSMVRSWHPDRVAHRLLESDLDKLQGIFARVNAAWAVLGDREKRAAYDKEEKEAIYQKPKVAEPLSPLEEARKLHSAGRLCIKEGSYAQAIEYLNHACRLAPQESKYAYYLGGAFFRAKRYKQAEEALKRAISMEGTNPDYYVALGQVYKAGKLSSRAEEMFDQALRLNPGHEQARREKKSLG